MLSIRTTWLNTALIVLLAAAGGKIASDLLAHRLGGVLAAPKTAPAAPPPVAGQDLMTYAPVLEKGLFGKATQGKLTLVSAPTPQAKGPGGAAAPPAANTADLVVLGTAIGSYNETFALVQKLSTREERVFRLGQTVFDVGPLVKVKTDVIELSVGGKRVTVTTPMAPGGKDAAPSPAAPAPAGGGLATATGSGSYVIDQRALNSALDNIGQAMSDARLLPSMKDGKVEGFRVSEVKSSGVFGMVGIRNGDVLLRMNDFPIDSPEKAIQSLASLKGQSRLKLDLIRNGQPTTFTYDIR